jgi:hypothetical protein
LSKKYLKNHVIRQLLSPQKLSREIFVYSLLLLYPAGGNSLFLLHPAGCISLLLLFPAGGNSLFLLHPAGGHSLLLLYPAGAHSLLLLVFTGRKQTIMGNTNLNLFPPCKNKYDQTVSLQVKVRLNFFHLLGKVRLNCFHLQGEVRTNCFHLQVKVRARSTSRNFVFTFLLG